jgi:UrcA family protein
MQRSIFALGITAALVFSGLAHAEALRKVAVSYADLDLSKANHAGVLYGRLQNAAIAVCAENGVPGSRALLIEHKCIAKAVDAAVQNIDNPNLTAIYQARTGKRAMVASSR